MKSFEQRKQEMERKFRKRVGLMFGGVFLVGVLYYGAIYLLVDKTIDAVQAESTKCGGIAKCSGKALGGFLKDFQEGMNE